MATHRYHFITGLPRSGSTLLSALLRQNPRFHAAMSSPVGGLFQGMLGQLGAGSEFGTLVSTEQRRRLGRFRRRQLPLAPARGPVPRRPVRARVLHLAARRA